MVHNFEDLFDMEEGDVLVTPATGEAFNAMIHLVGAIVTDHGSFACHAAIMARELGFPAVVGTTNGSFRIPKASQWGAKQTIKETTFGNRARVANR